MKILGTDGLGCILDDWNIPGCRKFEDPVHVATLPEEVDWNDRLDPIGIRTVERSLERFGGHVVRGRIHVTEDGRRAKPMNRSRSGEEGVARTDHQVTMTDLKALKREQDRIRTTGTTDCMRAAAVLRDIRLELGELRPSDEPLTLDDLANHRFDLITNGVVLSLQVEQRHCDVCVGCSGHVMCSGQDIPDWKW